MNAHIVLLPGDGIGPEVIAAAKEVLVAVATRNNDQFSFEEHLIGGQAIDRTGVALPEETMEACLESDAILLGAVGGPAWDDPSAQVRPEQGLLGIRKGLGLFANLRPIKPQPALVAASPLKPDRLRGVDLLVVRELTGGIYFGQPRQRRQVNGYTQALDTMVYNEEEVRRVAHLAFQFASTRRGKVTSVDKANILECSRLWRSCVSEVAEAYPAVTLEHLLVDAAAMHILTRPATFDVILTANMFGDILSDEASVLTGSLGNLPSAAIGSQNNAHNRLLGLYEPVHGSAPDITGQGIANPIGAILSASLLLRHSLGLEAGATIIENAVANALDAGYRTADLVGLDESPVTTVEMTELIKNYIVAG